MILRRISSERRRVRSKLGIRVLELGSEREWRCIARTIGLKDSVVLEFSQVFNGGEVKLGFLLLLLRKG